jgi:hypothetical protein
MHRRQFLSRSLAASCLAGAAGWQTSARACLHSPGEYEPWRTTDQSAIVFWRKGREELVLSLSYEANEQDEEAPNAKRAAGPGQALPADFGWVIPVPTAPDKYSVVDPKVFDLAGELSEKFKKPLPKQKFLGGAGAMGGFGGGGLGGVVVVHQTRVGEYDITALKGRGPQAATEVNAWLARNNYLGIPVADMEFYTAKGWTFLAVKVTGGKAQRLAAEGALRPLHISFASERVVYPLKLAPRPGAFSLRAYLFTEGAIQPPAWLKERGLEIETWYRGEYASAPVSHSNLRFGNTGYQNPLAGLWSQVQTGKFGHFQRPFFTVIGGYVNDETMPISAWKTDFELSTRA